MFRIMHVSVIQSNEGVNYIIHHFADFTIVVYCKHIWADIVGSSFARITRNCNDNYLAGHTTNHAPDSTVVSNSIFVVQFNEKKYYMIQEDMQLQEMDIDYIL